MSELDEIRKDIREMRQDIKDLLKITTANTIKVSIAGVLSGGIGAVAVLLVRHYGG
jgi:hypothetical protein